MLWILCFIIVYYYYINQIYNNQFDDIISENFEFEEDEINDNDINHKEGNNNNK